MLYAKDTAADSTPDTLNVAWGLDAINNLVKNNVVYIFGKSQSCIKQHIEQNPETGRLLDFSVVTFTPAFPKLTSPFFECAKSNRFKFYTLSNYQVDSIVSISDYHTLLESIAMQLEGKGYSVKRVIKKPISYEPKSTEGTGVFLKFFLEKPNFVDSFATEKSGAYTVFDSLPEPLSNTAFRLRGKPDDS